MEKKTSAIILAALLAVGCSSPKNNVPELKDVNDTLSWIMGESIANTIPKETFFDLDKEILAQAILYTLQGRQQPIDDSTYDEGLQYIMLQNYAYQKHQQKEQGNKADSIQNEYFRNLVSINTSVKKHPSGFYYEVLQEGSGPHATYAQRIRFDYRSYTLDGNTFDQTYGRRDPIIHVVGEPMFPGLIEAFQLMSAGSKYRFYFPYQLLAGDKTSGSVQAYTPMIYDIELHELYKD